MKTRIAFFVALSLMLSAVFLIKIQTADSSSVIGCPSSADSVDDRVKADIASFKGKVSLFAKNLDTGETYGLNADDRVRTASTIKIAVMVEAFARVAEGKAKWTDELVLTKEKKVSGSGVLQELSDGLHLTLRDGVNLMMLVSDNTATNLLIDRIGTGVVNDLMAGLGYEQTRLGRRMYDFAARDRGFENRCAAGEMTEMLVRLERRELVSAEASEAMLAIMKRQASVSKIPRLLPPDTPVANKTGEITGISHDVGLIYAPSGPIAISVLTEGARDRVAAEDAIGRIARAIYDAWGAEASS